MLRSSATHLATWGLLLFVLDLRRASASGEGPALAANLALVAATVLTSLTHERRIGKMAGPALEPVWPAAQALWRGLIAVLAGTSVTLAAAGAGEWAVPLWMGGVGAGLALWGHRARFRWYLGLGLALVATAAGDALLLGTRGAAPMSLRAVALVLVLPAAVLWTNRRWLWFRDRGPGHPA